MERLVGFGIMALSIALAWTVLFGLFGLAVILGRRYVRKVIIEHHSSHSQAAGPDLTIGRQTRPK
jgi:hypothetical protein